MNSHGSQLAAVVICFLVFTVTTVALRCYVRVRLTGGFGGDDALSVASLIVFVLGSACLLAGIGIGGFGHRWMDIPQPTLVQALKLFFIYEATYVIATCLVKLSIGLFLLRFTVERKYTWTLYIILAILLCFSIFLLFFAIFQCKPVSAFWGNPGTCNRTGTVKVTYAHSAIISASDWALVILPIFIVSHLNLGFRTKVYVGIILTLGSCASIATLTRFAYIHDLIDPSNLLFNMGLIITSHFEIGLALTASSAATLRPLLVRLRGVLASHGQSQDSAQRYLNESENARRYPSRELAGEIDIEVGGLN
ncbi:hypothetical protein BJY01DRAFT_258195 [Aspergillus pseudoustus]|uniref:Rhodopsin domain-containing protein n=1 Tax=Aspergillus pseudoustus TaxID=1810923 RepID=A0ABR4JD30_9EURO